MSLLGNIIKSIGPSRQQIAQQQAAIMGAGSGIKSGFGRVDKANARTHHAYGADLSYDSWGKAGTPVGSLYGTGKVVSVNQSGGGVGNQVVIDYGGGVQVAYNHLQDFGVKPGQTLKAGETLGRMGSSGNSPSGSHISYEFRRNGKVVPANAAFPDAAFPKEYWGGREGSWGKATEFDMKSKQFDVSPGVHNSSDGIPSGFDPMMNGSLSTSSSNMSSGGVNLGKLVGNNE